MIRQIITVAVIAVYLLVAIGWAVVEKECGERLMPPWVAATWPLVLVFGTALVATEGFTGERLAPPKCEQPA